MKTIGLIGGMSWESTLTYYQLINRAVNQQLGGLHSAKILLNSLDFAEIERLQHQDKWQDTADILIQAAQSLEKAGADCLLICTNTMHLVAEQIAKSVDLPLLHIADAAGAELVAKQISKVGLLGTEFTMQKPFYKQRLTDNFGIEVIVPEESEQSLVHQVIYEELCKGKVSDFSRQRFVDIINKLASQGAQGVILGCTEIGLLVQQQDCKLPLFDTTELHAKSAVKWALE